MAELLYRRALSTFADFEQKTGHSHPRRDTALGNYLVLLAKMGRSGFEIRTVIASLDGEDGPETRTSRTVFSDLFVVPAKAGTREKVVKSAALDARFRGHECVREDALSARCKSVPEPVAGSVIEGNCVAGRRGGGNRR